MPKALRLPQVPFDTIQLAASPLLLGNTQTEDLGRSLRHAVSQTVFGRGRPASPHNTAWNGFMDNFRLMAHARSQRNVCKSALRRCVFIAND